MFMLYHTGIYLTTFNVMFILIAFKKFAMDM